MTEEAAGYAMLAARLGRVRRVVGDGATALALVDPAAYYAVNGDGPDEDMTYVAPEDAAETHLRIAAWERQPCKWLGGSGSALEDALADIATLRSDLVALRDRVAALELERVAERGEM